MKASRVTYHSQWPYRLTIMWAMVCHPLALVRWLILIGPWIEEFRRQNFETAWLRVNRWESVRNLIEKYLIQAWYLAKRTPDHRRCFLPVISNRIDAPCEGCGRCCRMPKGESGFTVVSVLAWERKFRRLHPDLVRPHPTRPGNYEFHFIKERNGDLRCPLLTTEGRCGAYDHRPTACVVFNCADGMSDYSKGYNGADEFLYRIPEIKKRLKDRGVTEVDRYNTPLTIKELKKTWPSSTTDFGSTTVARSEVSDLSPRKTVSCLS